MGRRGKSPVPKRIVVLVMRVLIMELFWSSNGLLLEQLLFQLLPGVGVRRVVVFVLPNSLFDIFLDVGPADAWPARVVCNKPLRDDVAPLGLLVTQSGANSFHQPAPSPFSAFESGISLSRKDR